jgi:hypothetical protein
MNLTIDKEFKQLIPPLLSHEYEQLEKNILEEGIRDKLVVWNKTVVDGHNRYEIALRHGLPFDVHEMQFNSREDCINWIINNQLGRRNLTEAQRMYLRGKRYENEKKMKGGDYGNQYTNLPNPQNEDKAKFTYTTKPTALKIAKEYGVSPSTIERDALYSKGIDVLPDEVKQKIFSGEEKTLKKDIHSIAKLPTKLQKQVISKINDGAEISEAVKTTDPKIKKEKERKEAEEKYNREKEIRERLKFENIQYCDVLVLSLDEILENKDKLKSEYEIWVFRKKETAHKSKIELRKNLTLKFN